jgi:hypothetical protein
MRVEEMRVEEMWVEEMQGFGDASVSELGGARSQATSRGC